MLFFGGFPSLTSLHLTGIRDLSEILIFKSWCSTADEYRKTISKDAALERRFQPVTIDEPTVESTISILRGLKSKYEVHHGVEISDGALVTGEYLRYHSLSDPDYGIGW